MPFRLWPAQAWVLWQFCLHRLIIILKARQLGISWLCCLYALWLVLFKRGQVVLLFSKGQRESVELLRRVGVLYERLPRWLRLLLPRRTTNNTETMTWANGSSILSLPGTGGRSFTASLVIVDEAAHIAQAREIYMAVKPTIDAGGQLIILSTANGLGNLFHQIWVKAEAKANGFTPIFLPWWTRPGRDAAWYEAQKAEYTDPDMIHQEYPATPREAFVASGRSRFHGSWIEAQEARVREPLPDDQIPADLRPLLGLPGGGTFAFFAAGVIGRRYVIGGDVAEGLQNGDWSTAVVIDAETWEEMATLRVHCEPDQFAEYLLLLQRHYLGATLGIERNNHGHATLAALKRLGAPNVYRHTDKRAGHVTNAQTKPLSIDLLAEALRDALCTVRWAVSLSEMQHYRIEDDGDTSAPEGYHDDLVMAWAIALWVARHARVWDESAFG